MKIVIEVGPRNENLIQIISEVMENAKRTGNLSVSDELFDKTRLLATSSQLADALFHYMALDAEALAEACVEFDTDAMILEMCNAFMEHNKASITEEHSELAA